MNLTVKASDLLRVVKTAMHGLPRHAIIPESGLVRLVAKTGKQAEAEEPAQPGRLTAMCGNGDFNVEAHCDADVVMGGACLCIPDELHSAASLERENDVSLKISKPPKDELSVAGRLAFKGLTKAKLRIQGDFAFPRIQLGEPSGYVVIEEGHIKSLKVAGDSSSKAGDAYAMNVSISQNCITTFSKYTGMGTFIETEDTGAEAFIPLSYLERASKAIGQTTYHLFTRENESVVVQSKTDEATCSFVATNGKPLYPKPYLNIVPERRLFIETPISKILKAAQVFSSEQAGNPCHIAYADGNLSFVAVQAESDIETPQIPVRVEGDDVPFTIKFRITYLKMGADDMRKGFWMNFCKRRDDIMYVEFEQAHVKHVFMPLVTKEVKERELE